MKRAPLRRGAGPDGPACLRLKTNNQTRRSLLVWGLFERGIRADPDGRRVSVSIRR